MNRSVARLTDCSGPALGLKLIPCLLGIIGRGVEPVQLPLFAGVTEGGKAESLGGNVAEALRVEEGASHGWEAVVGDGEAIRASC